MPPHIFIARHGERLDFVDPSWCSTAERPDDAPLTPRGQEQAVKLGQLLRGKNIKVIYSSPFLRCIQTATAVQKQLSPTPPLNVEPGLCEWLNAQWYAASEKGPIWQKSDTIFARFDNVNRNYDPLFSYDWNFRGFPEGLAQLHHRCVQTVQRVVSAHGDDEGNILLVGHGSSIESLRSSLIPGVSGPSLLYCALTECVPTDTPLRYALGNHNNDISFYSAAL